VEIKQASNGDYVIPFDQPYSGYAKALLERQQYPNDLVYPGGPPKRPYDVTAHTLPLLFGVEARFVDQPVEGALKKADLAAPAARDRFAASDTDGWKHAGTPLWRNEAGDFALTRPDGDGGHEGTPPRAQPD